MTKLCCCRCPSPQWAPPPRACPWRPGLQPPLPAPKLVGSANLRLSRTCFRESRRGRRGAPPGAKGLDQPAARQGRSTDQVPWVGGSSPPHRRRVPEQPHSQAGPTCVGTPAPASPPQALLTWSWPKARSTAVTPETPAGMNTGATDDTLPRARRVPDPKKNCLDRPPRGGVTIRFQEREPEPPLGPAWRRHQLHPRSGARPRLPRDGKERKKYSRWRSA